MSSRLQERTDSFKQQLLTAQRRHLIGHLETTISGYEERIDRQQKLLDVILQPRIKVRGAADVQQLSDLKDLFKQQLLTAPREDLIGHFETTISRYQKEIDRQQKLLDVILQPEIKLRRAVVPKDVQQLLVSKDEVLPEQQEWSPSLDQEKPEPPHIKEEQEEVWTVKIPFTPPVPVKTEEEDEVEPQSSQLYERLTEQMKTEDDGENCGRSEPVRNSDPDSHLTPDTDDEAEDCFELEVQVSSDDENTGEARLGFGFENNDGCNSCEKLFSCSECGRQFKQNSNLKRHMRSHTKEKPFICTVCGKRYARKAHLQDHFRFHTGENLFSCSVCGKRYARKAHLQDHFRSHTEEKLPSCSVCGKCFSRPDSLHRHMRTHTREKPLTCNICDERFSWRYQLKRHKCGGELPQLQELSTSREQEEPEPQHIKEEQDEVWRSQEEEQLQEADITKFAFNPVPVKSEDDDEEKPHSLFTPVPVKSEDDEEKPQSSQLHQSRTDENRNAEHLKTEADGEACGGSEPVFNPEVQLHKADVQQLLVSKEEVTSEQQEWSPVQDCKKTPELPHIKEEQEELWTSQEGEQLQILEGADITEFSFTPVIVKSEEDDEERPQSSQIHQNQTKENKDTKHLKTAADGEDCEGSQPDIHLQPATHDKTSHCSDPETDDSCDWEKNRETRSGLCNTGKASVSSSECTATSGNSVHQQKHKETVTRKPFSCSVCEKGFTQKSNLRRHLILHSGEKPFSCSVCDKRFAQKGQLSDHSTLHTDVKPFSCSVCGRGFRNGRNLRRHMRIHTGEKPFSCSDCGKLFVERGYLKQHMVIHTDDKPFSCSVCGKEFGERRYLRRHMKIHTDDKLFNCSVCSKGFAERRYLRQHMSVHTDDKPFKCSVCDKEFVERRYLTQHMVIHTENKPFSCSICVRDFGDERNLRRHMRIHTGEKPFSCSVCGKGFGERVYLTQHMGIHTDDKPFSCQVCGKGIGDRRNLQRHMKIHVTQQK